MNRPRRTRRDVNQADIVEQCRQLGMVVYDLADLGGTTLDLVVWWRGQAAAVEVKQPGKEDELTDGERVGIAALKEVGATAIVATSVEDVLRAFE